MNFTIKENILKLYKKEVVVKNIIKNNLYSSAVELVLNQILLLNLQEFLDLKLIFKEI